MDNYTYKNCFKLANSSNNINNYFYDASNSNQPILNENDCADYAYYNNHPSFFFKNNKDNSNDISKCFVLKYNNIKSNNNDIDKETQINNITNLNYDLNNNKNLPRFNLKEEIDEANGNAVTKNTCNKTHNSLTYYLMKSFSNSYDINYNKITKRDKNNYVDYNILNEYYQSINTDANSDLKKSTLKSNFFTRQPTFNNLYTNNTYDANYMYYDMISLFINNTLYYSSNNGIYISIGHILYKTDTNNNPTTTGLDVDDIKMQQGMDPSDNDIRFFKSSNILMYPSYIGLPIEIYNSSNPTRPIITPSEYYYEKDYQYFINIVFVLFLIVESRDKLGNNKTFANFANYVNGEDEYVAYNSDERTNYSFTYANIHRALVNTSGGDKLFNFDDTLYSDQPELKKAVNKFLQLLLYTPNDADTIQETCRKIKSSLYPDIIDKFLSTDDKADDSTGVYKYKDFKSFYGSMRSHVNYNYYMNLFRKIYTGEHRLLAIEEFFKERQKILVNENNLIKQDINNMKTYIDNIYLHSKLNNIENYIYNEKSKLKYLFNKNSSEKQKNDDLKFLNNFILTENIIICIIIFILILFFIKK